MYQDRSAANQQAQAANDSERFLLGEAVKQLPGGDKDKPDYDRTKNWGQTASSSACPENEAFLKMMEDPMIYIK